jgi:type VI secretion system secreted protein VgrG
MQIDSTLAASARMFELSTGPLPEQTFHAVSFRSVERFSRPFRFEIVLALGSEVSDPGRALLDAGATFEFVGGGVPRVVSGVVRRVRAEPSIVVATQTAHLAAHRGARVRVTLVPRLARLGENRNSRIFQDRTVRQIVDGLLEENAIDRRWHVARELSPRPYAVQYEESDLAFCQRLLAEEGIFYYFEHGADRRDTVILADESAALEPIDGDPRLPLMDRSGLVGPEGRVLEFSVDRRVQATSTLIRDFDFFRPSLDLAATAPQTGRLNGSRAPASAQRVYEHHGAFEGEAIDRATAERRLQQHRARALLGRGASRCARLATGRWFELVESPAPEHDGRWVVARVEHHGDVPEVTGAAVSYQNRFVCVPAAVAFRPKRPRRVVQQVLESATVVGPAGQDVHTDELGRIRVRFHWDRHDQSSETSCWIRTMQTWAGVAWGAQFIPRIGMEVLVAFLGGDVDRPVVIGCAYNAEHPTPFPLPRNKTKSGWRTQSSGGAAGFNELSFEDQAGHEVVAVHAQRDLNVTVGHDSTTRVAANSTEQVSGNRFSVIAGNVLSSVGGDVTGIVSGSARRSIDGDESLTVNGSEVRVVNGDADSRVLRELRTRVGVRERLEVDGERVVTVAGDQRAEVRGSAVVIVGRHDAKRSTVLHVEGATTVSSTGVTEISADAELVLRSGDSAVRITPEGVQIDAKRISLAVEGATLVLSENKIQAHADSKVFLASDDKAILKGSGAVVVLDADAKVNGASVKLKSGDASADSEENESGELTTIELVDPDGNPLPNRPFRVELDGKALSGVLDENGRAQVRFEGSGRISFPGLVELEEA